MINVMNFINIFQNYKIFNKYKKTIDLQINVCYNLNVLIKPHKC